MHENKEDWKHVELLGLYAFKQSACCVLTFQKQIYI